MTESALAMLGILDHMGYSLANFESLESGRIGAGAYQTAVTVMRAVRAAAPDLRLDDDDGAGFGSDLRSADSDYDQLQRLASALAAEIGAEVRDLRDPLWAARLSVPAGNMHWLEEGHGSPPPSSFGA